MLLNTVYNIGTIPPTSGFPYVLPILSKDSTGSSSDWTIGRGTGLTALGSDNLWIADASDDRCRYYQSFAVLSSQHSVIDQGNARVRIQYTFKTLGSDSDQGIVACEFWDGSSNFLGRVFTTSTDPDDTLTDFDETFWVPPSTRTIHVSVQGKLGNGSPLSFYWKITNVTLQQGSGVVSAEMIWSELNADITGWTVVTSNITDSTTAGMTSTDDWEGRLDRACYLGGPSNPYSKATKAFSVPSGWASKISAGKARIRISFCGHNANNYDDVGLGIEYQRTGGNSTVQTGRTEVGIAFHSFVIDDAVPTDTTSFLMIMEFWRSDGSYNDGAISQISFEIYEVP